MKARLLYRDRDADLQSPLPWNEEALVNDLELNTLFAAMARDDEFVFDMAKAGILTSLQNDLETIRYRQGVLQDCLSHPTVVRQLYAVAVEAVEQEKKHYLGSFMMRHPDWVLRRSIELLEALLGITKELRKIADSHADKFVSEGWTALFATVRKELSDEYLARVEYHLAQLKFRHGVLLSAQLGRGNKGTAYVLHLPPDRIRSWLMRLVPGWLTRFFAERPPVYSFSLHPRDESGARALSELQNRAIGIAANALGQSSDHVRNFFGALRVELAFYVGCVNLHEQLGGKGEPLCLPSPVPAQERRHSFRGLYDACLALNMDQRVVGNDANAEKKDLVIVTGANQGGKSTFLRSVGLAQLMMQCGMFVPAESFGSSVCDGLFTHFKREEDAGMRSGRLDEELGRMSDIVDHLTSYPMILLNESFAATNEREGSEIARQITSALIERPIKMVFVTHLYEFAQGVHVRNSGSVLFLRADRQADGSRTFKLRKAEPLQTSFGDDLYDSIFGAGDGRREARGRAGAAPRRRQGGPAGARRVAGDSGPPARRRPLDRRP